MIEIFKQLEIPSFVILIILIALYIIKEFWITIKSSRVKAAQDVLQKMLNEIDTQVSEFYMPLRQRLDVTYRLFEATNRWIGANGRFDNSIIELESDDDRALSKIVNHRMFFPLNKEAENILLSKTHLKHANDKTDYEAMLLHYVQWSALEDAVIAGEILSYNGKEFLPFPIEEADKQRIACKDIIEKRDELRRNVLKLQNSVRHINKKKKKA